MNAMQLTSKVNLALLNNQSVYLPDEFLNEKSQGRNAEALYRLILCEMNALGYEPSVKLTENLSSLSESALVAFRKVLVPVLKTLKGADKEYVPLMKNFPRCSDAERDYFMLRVAHFVTYAFEDSGNWDSTQIVKLSCGCQIDTRLFDISEFSKCPVCQRNSSETSSNNENHLKRQKNLKVNIESKIKPTNLEYMDDEAFEKMVVGYLKSNASATGEEKELLETVLRANYDLGELQVLLEKVETIPFKETQAMVNDVILEKIDESKDNDMSAEDIIEILSHTTQTATDVLRFASKVSTHMKNFMEPYRKENPNSSFFKLNNRNRKVVMGLLDRIPVGNAMEDVKRYRNAWIRLAEIIHAGTFKKRFPNAYKVLDTLRNKPKNIRTVNGKFDVAMNDKDYSDAVNIISKRPGEFSRKLDLIIRRIDNDSTANITVDDVLDKFMNVGANVSTKVLIECLNNFKARQQNLNTRLSVKSGRSSSMSVLGDKREHIQSENVDKTVQAISHVIASKFSDSDTRWNKVFIDSSFTKEKVPLKLRSNKSSFNMVERGSVIQNDKINDSSVIRIFTYWNEKNNSNGNNMRVDIDLSAAICDEDFNNPVETCFYGNIGGREDLVMKHSGDIQEGPGTEFIDVDIEKVKKRYPNARYVIVTVNSFTSQPFDQYDCIAGFMTRNSSGRNLTDQAKQFDPSTVNHKFDLYGDSRFVIPYIYDLEKNEIIWVNMDKNIDYAGANIVSTSLNDLKAIINKSKCDLSIAEFLTLYSEAKGATNIVYGKAEDLTEEQRQQFDKVLDRKTVGSASQFATNWF